MKKQLVLVLLVFAALQSYAQSNGNVNSNNFQKMVDILPPAPNAAAIIKHEAIGVGNTGSPNINIPLFALKGNKLAASVSIGYSSTGIKVDEIASRVGMGWSMQAGGVVTRTVRGWADENCTRLTPTMIGYNCATYDFCDKVANSNNGGPYDAEPDLFNFNMNGLSGSFVLDASMNPIVMPAQKFKIEKNFSGTTWNFKITATDGVMYYFGGTGATEKTRRMSACGKNFNTYLPTAWYLTKIEHPTGETITFSYTAIEYNYDTGISETMNWGLRLSNCPSGLCPPAPPDDRCYSLVRTQGVLLSTISNTYGSINFMYESRLDCDDKLVSYITQYNGGTQTGKFNFFYNQQVADASYQNEVAPNHNYIPYLTDLQQLSSDNLVTLTHRFVYNDPAGRPARLSFSQDHWGYFNGKHNTTMVPVPSDPYLRTRFPNATANREVDPAFAGKGMLTKVVYPTGGVDIIEYEPNEYLHRPTYSTPHDYDCSIRGTGTANNSVMVTKSTTFTVDQTQNAVLSFSCIFNNNGTVYDNYNYSEVEVLDVINNHVIYSYGLHTGESETVSLNSGYLAPGTYTLTFKAKGEVITTSVSLKYNANSFLPVSSNTIVGGVRVKRILTGNPSATPMVKRYYYAEPATLDESSLYHVNMPVYLKPYKTTLPCDIGFQGIPNYTGIPCDYLAMVSGSLNNIFDYQGAAVSYSSIIESEGEQFEGGAKQTRYYTASDVPGSAALGTLMPGAPMSNFSIFGNGRVFEEIYFKKSGLGNLVPVKKVHNNLFTDTRASTDIYGYAVNQSRSIIDPVPSSSCTGSTAAPANVMDCFDITQYHISAPWIYINSQEETLYDENGANPVTTTQNFYYDNIAHLQLSRTESTNSKGQLVRQSNTYPSDQGATAPYTTMVTNNILSPVVTATTTIVGSPNTPVQQVAMDYGSAGGNNYAPVTVKKSVKGNALETEGTIDQYDAKGNILQFTGKDEVVSCIIWGYDYQYPVAKITGASYSSAIAALTVSVASLQSMTGTTLRNELNNIRVALTAAHVVTYTYTPGIGVTSITDPNNRISTYEYDAMNRLVLVKDQDGNAVKKNEYYVVGSNPASGLNIYFNQQQSRNVTCNNCALGYTGSTVQYVVPYGRYFSLVSQLDADQQADADNGGQEYANRMGKCTNTVTCPSDPRLKVVGCECEAGVKVCDYAINNNNGTYSVRYHYVWSDGVVGPNIDETITCSGPDKKIINCACETGQKICEITTNNNNGTYTVSYHYKWSDNSTSSTYTETVSCSGIDKKMVNCNCETAAKKYVSSVICGKLNPPAGCCLGMWLCQFYYKWTDGSTYPVPNPTQTYLSECSPETCILTDGLGGN